MPCVLLAFFDQIEADELGEGLLHHALGQDFPLVSKESGTRSRGLLIP